MMRILFPMAGLGVLLLAGCSTQATFDRVPTTGRFSGEPRMVAIAPDNFFFFQPKQDPPFAFTTHHKDEVIPANHGRGKFLRADWRIQPEDLITDGASVPRQVWYLPGFAAFDYTRAALIHDWLFEAHHRYTMAEAADKAAKLRNDQRAMKRSEEDLQRYREYKDITQEDAADIFAECIKSAMLESADILDQFKKHETPDPNGAPAPEPATLKSLKDAFANNRPHAPTLWAYHYFVSPDCFVGTSKKAWNDRSSDFAIFRVLASKEVAAHVEKNGYLSKWMIHRFREILRRGKERHDDYQHAVQQGIVAHDTRHPKKIATQQIAPPPPSPTAAKHSQQGT